jgi:hypothetical protein
MLYEILKLSEGKGLGSLKGNFKSECVRRVVHQLKKGS